MYNNINIITNNDLCVSCGTCVHICPFTNIKMEYNSFREKWDAVVQNKKLCLKCSGKEICCAVCPSYDTDYVKLAKSDENNLMGRIKKVYNGYSRNNDIRTASSSGGFIKELSGSLIAKKEIDGIISLVHQRDLEHVPEIINSTLKMTNAIYHSNNFENAIKLLKDHNGKYLIIGLPCHISSIQKLIDISEEFSYLKERIYAKVALICGYSFDRINIKAFAHYYNFSLKEISYRGDGRFRKTIISNKEDKLVFNFRNPASWTDYVNSKIITDKFLSQNGCLYCVDHIGYCADLVIGDAWQKRYEDDNIGTNIIIARTEKGEDLISKIDNFYFENGLKEEIIESQSVLYALGSIGEGMKSLNFKNKYFYPNHKRINDSGNIKIYKFRIFDIVKIVIVKQLLRKRRFKLAKSIYAIIEFPSLLGHFIKNMIKKKLNI